MGSKHYLTIDTSAKPNQSHDFTIYLKKEINDQYRKICLKSLYVQHENDVAKLFVFTVKKSTVYKPLYVHCNMLNKDDNFINGRSEGSDVIAILYPVEPKGQKTMLVRFNHGVGKQISHSNHLRLHMTNFEGEPLEHKTGYFIIYELEFF